MEILAVVIAATLAACTLEAAATMDELGSSDPGSEIAADDFVAAQDSDVLAASDCLTEDDCEYYPEQAYAQCVAACNAGVAAIEQFCALIPYPAIRASCYAMRFGGPVVCANWCYWYYAP